MFSHTIHFPYEIARKTGMYLVVDMDGNPVINDKGCIDHITISTCMAFPQHPENPSSKAFGYLFYA